MADFYAVKAITKQMYEEIAIAGNPVANENDHSFQYVGSGASEAVVVLGGYFQYFDNEINDGLVSSVVGLSKANINYEARFYGLGVKALVGLTEKEQIAAMFNGNDIIQGNRFQSENDVIEGHDGNDLLDGGLGNDTIDGGAGNDTISGGLNFGKDTFIGGAGADRFTFHTIWESAISSAYRDTITDFSHGQKDRIDLRDIDANVGKGGNQAFHFIGSDAFSHQAGELRFGYTKGGNTLVSGDIGGDGKANFSILLNGHVVLHAEDFLL